MSLLIMENDARPRPSAVAEEDRKSFLANASFPKKLFDLVTTGDVNVVRWEEHGKAFRIIDSERFAEQVLPLYFRHSKLTSFQRQLNLYGFRRITKGEDQGSYYHAKFQRDKPAFVSEIRRLQGKAMPVTPAAPSQLANKKNIHFVDKNFLLNQNIGNVPSAMQLDCIGAAQQEVDCGGFDMLAPQPLLPSGFGTVEETPNFSRNVSDFGWCNSPVEGFEDFDPLDLNLLDALFDSDTPSTMN